jgi:large subunit ribosomal protein L9
MKVILLADIPKVGSRGDVKNVSEGYARNFLFPRKLAKHADEHSLKELEAHNESQAKEAEEDLAKMQALASALDGLEVEIGAKASDKGELYSQVSAAKIAEALSKKGHEVKKSEVKVLEPIKKIGEYPVTISLRHGLEAEIKVTVTEEAS